MRSLILVADDAGFASTDRGIRVLAEETGLPICADYMIGQEGAVQRAREMQRVENVSIGLHFELSGIADAKRYALARTLRDRGQTLGQQPEIRQQAERDVRRQHELFSDTIGYPAHISTHGNFNLDFDHNILPWWHNLMGELYGSQVPPMQFDLPVVRHNLYSWTTPEYARPPRTPEEFAGVLREMQSEEAVEFVMHPALPEAGDASIDMLFDAESRIADLRSASHILLSGVIEREGFRIVPVHELQGRRSTMM